MKEKDIYKILKIILEKIKDKNLIWRLEGSANLKVQMVEVNIKDLDITTDEKGIKVFRDNLKEYVVKDFYNDKIKGTSLICRINSFEVEINSYDERKLNMFDKNKEVLWRGLKIPILPLEYAVKFYELIKRKKKVNLINEYLHKQQLEKICKKRKISRGWGQAHVSRSLITF